MKRNLFDIQDHVVVITGGTGVLGREIASYLAAEGAEVVLLGRNRQTGVTASLHAPIASMPCSTLPEATCPVPPFRPRVRSST